MIPVCTGRREALLSAPTTKTEVCPWRCSSESRGTTGTAGFSRVETETCRYIPGRSLPIGSSGAMRAVKERLRVSPEGEMLITLPLKVSPG